MPTTVNRGYPWPVEMDPARVPADMGGFLVPIDADMQELRDRMNARETLYIVHEGDGSWSAHTGLGEAVPVQHLGDGTWEVVA